MEGRRVFKILGDGNCIFRAISYHVYDGKDRFFYLIRRSVVNHVVSNWAQYCNFIIGGTYDQNIITVDEYKEYMSTNGWGLCGNRCRSLYL